jgi:hypothetical protein
MPPQKPLTHFFKPLQSGGVKRTFSELVSGNEAAEAKNVQIENKVGFFVLCISAWYVL